ncbi:MAG: cache domain-containing protein [Patescibacteria group bacterium]|nr:cache domain-containing protein [Patescibacteria group bacterium]
MFKNFKIGTKLLSGIIISILFASVTSYFITENTTDNLVKIESDIILKEISKNFTHILDTNINMLSSSLDLFLDNKFYKDIFIEKDREKLYTVASPIFEKIKNDFGITHFYFHTPEGYTFLRLHNKGIYGDEITRFTFDQAKETKKIGAGIELGKTAFALRVVKPYYENKELIGYVEFGEEIDHFLEILKTESGGDFSIFVQKKYLDKEKWKSVRENKNLNDNWNSFGDEIVINSNISEKTLNSDKIFKKCFNSENSKMIQNQNEPTFISIYDSEEKKGHMCGGLPLYDAGKRLVGSILIIKDFSEFISVFEESQFNFIKTLLLLFVLIVIIYFVFIYKTIVNPIKNLILLTQEISKGNLTQKISSNSDDEIGQLTKSFNKMTDDLSQSRNNTEQKIKKRTEQLEKMNKSMTGRELKMIELKKEIIKLKKKINN